MVINPVSECFFNELCQRNPVSFGTNTSFDKHFDVDKDGMALVPLWGGVIGESVGYWLTH